MKMIYNFCYFGSYDKDYSRNRIIIKGLIKHGKIVYNCRASGIFFLRFYSLIIKFLSIQKHFDFIIVGFPGHYDVPLAFILGKIFKKKILFDIFTSTYETYVIDRQLVNKYSPRALLYFFVDWLSLKLADYVIVDTKSHGNFLNKTYGIRHKKQILIYLGSDTDYYYPKKVKETTDVLFYGSYQPLQGTDKIVHVASILPNVKFKMIGEGKKRLAAEQLASELKLRNIEFVNWLTTKDLAIEISKAKVALGIFGINQKANVVIPNKVYDAIASKIPVITRKTKAIEEVFTNGKHIILVDTNPHKIASAIKSLLKYPKKRNILSEKAYTLFLKKFTPEKTASNLMKVLK